MELEKTVRELSQIERKTLSCMKEGKNYSFEELVKATGLNPDSVRRASAWLLQKKLLQGKESRQKKNRPDGKRKEST